MREQRKLWSRPSTPGPAGRRWARPALYGATAVVTVAFGYLALRGVDFEAAWRGLRGSDWWWLLPALIAFGLGNVARALRWRSLFPPARRPPSGTTANAMMIGYLYNNILPSRAGEAARILVLGQRSSSPTVEIAGTAMLERLYDIVAILLVFFVAEPWLPHVDWLTSAVTLAGILLLAIVVVVAVLAIYGDRPVRLLLRPLRRFAVFHEERLESMVTETAHGLAGLRNLRVALEALAWTLLAWLMSVACAYLCMRAFHLQLPFAAGVLVMVAVGLSMILPAAPAAVGVFEGATLIALKAYGLSHTAALPYALVLHLVNFLPFIVVGVILLHYNARHPAQSRAAIGGSASDRDGEPRSSRAQVEPPTVERPLAGATAEKRSAT